MSDIDKGKKIGKFIFGIGLGVKDQIISNKYDYKIIKHFKQVTVYKNGHGIIETRFKIKIFNPENFKKFYRNINISDAKPATCFPDFDTMINTDKQYRLSRFGLWNSCENNIIKNIKKCNDVEDNDFLSNFTNHPGKDLSFKFIIDNSQIKKNGIYEFSYSVSIPGMYNINGFNPLDNSFMKTQININHYTENVEYLVAFDKDFSFEQSPICEINKKLANGKHKNKNIVGEYVIQDFYHKYYFRIHQPEFNNKIKIEWKLKK